MIYFFNLIFKIFISPILLIIEDKKDPCSPSPCGPNSKCQVINDQAVCSCLPEFTGSPPGCRPECVVSSECPSNLACINQKCINPCPGPCGTNAECNVIHHSPICACRQKYTGDPFSRCFPMPGERNFFEYLKTFNLIIHLNKRF